jgi:hypothetical protein
MPMPMNEPWIALRVGAHDEPALAVRVNFGIFAGRHVTPAEIDDLAHLLRDLLPSFSIISEERHEFGGRVEAAVHQVVIEVPRGDVSEDPDLLAERLVLTANGWAIECIASRHGGGDL